MSGSKCQTMSVIFMVQSASRCTSKGPTMAIVNFATLPSGKKGLMNLFLAVGWYVS